MKRQQEKKNNSLLIILISLFVLIAVLLSVILMLGDGIWIIEGLNGKAGMNGKDGKDGENGSDGIDGANGKSAYELALEDGFVGSLHEWLLSLAVRGGNGQNGTGISSVYVNSLGELIVTLTNGKILNAGVIASDGSVSGKVDAEGFYEVFETVVMNDSELGLKLRAKPEISTESEVLFAITPGTELLRVGDQRTENGFSRFIYQGKVCYARSKYFDFKYAYTGEIPVLHVPSQIVLTVGVQSWFYTDQILPDRTDDMIVTYHYSGKGTRIFDGDDAFAITPAWSKDASVTPHAPERTTLTVKVEKRADGDMRVLGEYAVDVVVVEEQKSVSATGIFIGDSRISDNTILTALSTSMPNLRLLGTRQTLNSGIMHEGRSSWSIAEFLNSEYKYVTETQRVENAFYNPTTSIFDFSYYMSRYHQNATLDFVVINLGANDNFSEQSVQNLAAMVESIQTYATVQGYEIKILVMTEYLSPSSGYYLSQSYNTDISAKRAKQFNYFTYLTEEFGGRENEGIYLLPNYVCINAWSDWTRETVSTESGEVERITDVVHLGTAGYKKEAAMLRAYFYWLFGLQSE